MAPKLFTQGKIFFRLHRNYRALAARKSWLIYIFSMPLFGYLFSFPLRVVIWLDNHSLIDKVFSHTVCLAALRFLTPVQRNTVARHLASYNTRDASYPKEQSPNGATSRYIKQLERDGYCDLGIVFSEDQCAEFRRNLEGKECFDSQSVLQSTGRGRRFDPHSDLANSGTIQYITFPPATTLSLTPLREFLASRELREVVDGYLGFRGEIYSCATWYNPQSTNPHYVHRLHRDYDDYKYLGLVVYWNAVDRTNGALSFVKKSHNSLPSNIDTVLLEGQEGQVFLVDFFGLHAGNSVDRGCRYTTFMRFGKPVNYLTVIDGGTGTPTLADLHVQGV